MTDTLDWQRELTRLEGRLLKAWVRGPGFRERWTPVPEQFFTIRSQALARACALVAKLGAAPDAGTQVMAQLGATGDLKRHWKPGDTVLPDDTIFDPDADLAQWQELRISFALRQRLTETLSGWTPASPLSGMRKAVLEATSRASVSGAVASYSMGQLFTLAWEMATRKNAVASYTGYPQIDEATGGLRPGETWVLAASTNWGKTSWLLSVADKYISTHGKGVLYVTCEDTPEMLGGRWVARRSGLCGTDLRDAKLEQEGLGLLTEELNWAHGLGPAPVLIDGRGRSCEVIAEDIRQKCAEVQIDLVIVDYLQCIRADFKAQDRRLHVHHVSRTLVQAIQGCNATGLFGSQEKDGHVRDCNDVENDATVVLIGEREGDTRSLRLKKSKTGPAGFSMVLNFDPWTGAFLPTEIERKIQKVSDDQDDMYDNERPDPYQ